MAAICCLEIKSGTQNIVLCVFYVALISNAMSQISNKNTFLKQNKK